MRVFCGIDWAEDHHDVALVDAAGKLVAKRRIGDDAAGFAALLQMFADAGDSSEEPIPVAIETSRGLLVACLRATGREVFAINPLAVSRYRDRGSERIVRVWLRRERVTLRGGTHGGAGALATVAGLVVGADGGGRGVDNSQRPRAGYPARNL